MTRCQSCGGTYEPIAADGTRYFHACAPLVDAKTGRLVLRPNHRDENVPPPRVLTPTLDAILDAGGDGGHRARNQAADAAMISAGDGATLVLNDVPEVK